MSWETAILTNCTVRGNTASESGGGLYNTGTANLTNRTFSYDKARKHYGGGLYNNDGRATLVGCTFSYNAAAYGGGLYSYTANDPDYIAAKLTSCTFSNNSASHDGGGLFNVGGTANLNNCSLSGNNTASESGGGLYNVGTANLTNCTVSGNGASDGGGLYNGGTAKLNLTNCTVSGNTASKYGGGVYNANTANLTNCTFSNNTAGTQYYGGGLYNVFGAWLVSCTFSNNTAGFGGGLYNTDWVSLTNTIVARNAGVDGGPDVYSDLSVHSQGYNLIGNVSGSSGWDPNLDVLNQDPNLAPLDNYGGPTETMALPPNSPAIGKGTSVPGVTTDQRGFPPDTPNPDIGAFQFQSRHQFTGLGLGNQTRSVTYGTAGSATFDVAVDFDFTNSGSNTVTFSFSWGTTPAGASTSFSPTSVTGTSTSTLHATLTISTAAATPAGSFHFTVTGTGNGGVQHSASGSDTVTGRVERYDNKNVGTGKALRVTGYTVNDGNSGHNYTVSLVANTTGVINPGAASKLLFTTQPPGRLIIGQRFRVVGQFTDNFGNPVKLSGKEVTIEMSSGTLNGTTTVKTNRSGQAVFENLSVLRGWGTDRHRLTISAKGYAKGLSRPFQILGGGAGRAIWSIRACSSKTCPHCPSLEWR